MEQQQKSYQTRVSRGGARYFGASVLGFAALLLLCAAAATLFLLWFNPMRVDGDAMAPCLENGDLMLIDRLGLYEQEPERGDLVVCRHPYDGSTVLLRTVAFAGEKAELVNGELFLSS